MVLKKKTHKYRSNDNTNVAELWPLENLGKEYMGIFWYYF